MFKKKFSLNRLEFSAELLSDLNGENIIDLGCRGQELKNFLKGSYNYIGVDFNDNVKSSKLLNHNLENGYPNIDVSPDITVCLDVLEHLDNAHQLRNEILKKTKKKIIIALPNMAYYKFRLKFLFFGELSGKYPFGKKKPIDRHKWITNLNSADEFMSVTDNQIWQIKKINFIAHRRRNFIMYYLEKILAKFFPNIFVYEKLFYLIKKV